MKSVIGLLFGLVFILAGLASKFLPKRSAWTPDVYEGHVCTAFFAATPKIVAGLNCVTIDAFEPVTRAVQIISFVAIASMLLAHLRPLASAILSA